MPGSAIFGQAATASADGAANSSYDSYASVGGAVLMLNVMLGEVAPGGAGSGLYGLVMMALLAVFLGGLMIARTPEYLRQRLHSRHMKLISLYILTLPAAVLIGTAVAMALPGEPTAMLNAGPHGLSEVLYAFTSVAAPTTAAPSQDFPATPRGTTSCSPSRWWRAGSCRSSPYSRSPGPSRPSEPALAIGPAADALLR